MRNPTFLVFVLLGFEAFLSRADLSFSQVAESVETAALNLFDMAETKLSSLEQSLSNATDVVETAVMKLVDGAKTKLSPVQQFFSYVAEGAWAAVVIILECAETMLPSTLDQSHPHVAKGMETVLQKLVDVAETQLSSSIDQEFSHVAEGVEAAVLKLVEKAEENLSTLEALDFGTSLFLETFLQLCQKYLSSKDFLLIRFLLYTRRNPHQEYVIEATTKSLKGSPFNPALPTKFLISGYDTVLTDKNTSLHDIKDAFLSVGDFNVIIVDWSQYTTVNYILASVYAALVGFETSTLIHFLMAEAHVSPSSIHLIGHSLGAQISGFVGKTTPGIGRITALDAAGPLFQYLPEAFKIFVDDAMFVDSIHSNAAYAVGAGFILPFADLDFFPNGGLEQPNCNYGSVYKITDNTQRIVNSYVNKMSCNHDRSIFLFLASIKECRFPAFNCESYEDFLNGTCTTQNSLTSLMGYPAKPMPHVPRHTKFYLKTTGIYPFCLPDNELYKPIP